MSKQCPVKELSSDSHDESIYENTSGKAVHKDMPALLDETDDVDDVNSDTENVEIANSDDDSDNGFLYEDATDSDNDEDDDDRKLRCFLNPSLQDSDSECDNDQKFTLKDVLAPAEFMIHSNEHQYSVPSNEVPHLLTSLLGILNGTKNKNRQLKDLQIIKETLELFKTETEESDRDFEREAMKHIKALLKYDDLKRDAVDKTKKTETIVQMDLAAMKKKARLPKTSCDKYESELLSRNHDIIRSVLNNAKHLKPMEKQKPKDLCPSVPELEFSKDLDELFVGLKDTLSLSFAKGTEEYQLYALRTYMFFYKKIVVGKPLFSKYQPQPFPMKKVTFLMFLIWARQSGYAYKTVKDCFCNALCRLFELNAILGASPRAAHSELVSGVLRALVRKYGKQTFKVNALLNGHMFAWIDALDMNKFSDIMLKTIILIGRYSGLRGDSLVHMNLGDVNFNVKNYDKKEFSVNLKMTVTKEKDLRGNETRELCIYGKKNQKYCPVIGLLHYLFIRDKEMFTNNCKTWK
ncbi:hypothetical protein FDP41_007555 [Naegleria fowleri]|uniref:Uncharacterized protein n=1 Tax=Naegleria fowleri TaxID=5763 RepID=A0A6A5BJA5_NAEFO|nr:uncharacterized protein FDP41_003315 [Naegleria fowleri]XP_044569091.1 uncharacterized protein FDP41_007555 [Naegleria fowleri]KAF0977993.1 hypothetical protein FDP41_003315 [Naegleria fowleri]KAF0984378.1 hypothetical protein FDP41_007555 [Naegleria fowleri]